MNNSPSTFDRALRKYGAAALAIFAVILFCWSVLIVGLDDKGTLKPWINTWKETAFLGYGVLVAGCLFWLSWRVAYSGKPIRLASLAFPIAVLALHSFLLLPGASSEALNYLLASHLPLVVGISLLALCALRNGA